MTCYDVFLRLYCLKVYKDMISSSPEEHHIAHCTKITYFLVHFFFLHTLCYSTVIPSSLYKRSKMNPLCSHCVVLYATAKALPADWMHAELVLHGGRNRFQICSGNGALGHILHHIIPVWMHGGGERGGKEGQKKQINLSLTVHRIITCSCHVAVFIHIS